MSQATNFDDALPKFAALLAHYWGKESVERNVFLRDVSGRITLVVLESNRSPDERHKLGIEALKHMGQYVDKVPNYVISTPQELFDDSLTNSAEERKIVLMGEFFDGPVRLIDRRAVGADWLQTPSEETPHPVRFVFASLKGGVGRSTALCVLAAHLASKGRRVLAIDMDLEAPGLGNMLLSQETLPMFGLLDYLVERGLENIDKDFYIDLIGPSWVGGGRGRVDVIPAVGRNSLENPENVLSKIARAYLAGISENGSKTSFTTYIRDLIELVAKPKNYDVVLIDARAGLHETTASALLGLGAEILLFGSAQPQTFLGFRLLLAHLATLPNAQGWSERLRIIHAKAELSSADFVEFSSSIGALFEEYFHPRNAKVLLPELSSFKNTFAVEWDDSLFFSETSTPSVLSIKNDENYKFFDPEKNKDLLDASVYEKSFGDFLKLASEIVDDALTNPEIAER